MKPIANPTNTHTSGTGPAAIPITKTEAEGQPALVSFWQPTREEVGLIMSGAPVVLLVVGDAMPIVSLTAVKV
jgi:hypothetical protein